VWAGNFNGHTMQGVSGVTGAGPLLHRAIMATAKRISPGALTTPAEVGAVSVPVCRLSGLLATADCAQLSEWFVPGTVPTQRDDWEHGGRVTLPVEYADWAAGATAGAGREPRGGLATGDAGHHVPERDSASSKRFRILSPLDGDRYAIPSGVEARYATISLRAAGSGAEHVRWTIDGRTYTRNRWSLEPGPHVVQAMSSGGETAEARITVEP